MKKGRRTDTLMTTATKIVRDSFTTCLLIGAVSAHCNGLRTENENQRVCG